MYKLIAIKIDPAFKFKPYSHLFSNKTNNHINSFYRDSDQVLAFTSAVLKYYYLPLVLGLDHATIQIKTNAYGKPYILDCPHIDFSISHSGKYIILGIALNKKIGVDIELLNQKINLEIKSMIFSDFESKLINNYYDFFVIWSKKEAYLKCLGTGFSTEDYKYTSLNNQLVESWNHHQITAIVFKENYILTLCISD
jgi:4'-phosphopantetheinyl transferase